MKSLFIRVLALLLACFIAVALVSSLVFKWVSHELSPHEKHFTKLSENIAVEAISEFEKGRSKEFSRIFGDKFNGKVWILDDKNNTLTQHSLPPRIKAQVSETPLTIYPHQNRAGRFFIFAHEVISKNVTYKVIMTSRKPAFGKGSLWILWFPLIIIVFGLIVASMLLSYWMLRPLRIIRQASRSISADDLQSRIPNTITNRNDAFGDLGREINQMTDRVNLTMENQNQLLQDISHELRSPLARIQVATSLVEQKFGASSETNRIEDEVEKLNSMIEDLISLSRLKNNASLKMGDVNLFTLIQHIVKDANFEFQQSNKSATLHGHREIIIQGNEELLASLFENVIRNSLRYTPENDVVNIEMADNGAFIDINVIDRGPGVPDESIERIFDPFYRVDESRTVTESHHGIGLAIAKTVAELHGGKIAATNNPQGGLRVSIQLQKIN